MSVVPAVPVAASGNAFVDAQERLNELNLRAVAVLTHVEAGITRPKDALPFVDELIYISGYQLKCCCINCHKRSYSTSASRVVDHLMSCPLCPDSIKMLLMSLREGTKKKRKQKGEEEMKLVKVETELALQGVKAEKRQQTLCASIGAAENQVAGTAISRFFYSNKIQLDRVSCVPWYYIKHIIIMY
jgi:hypothetical protein